MIGARFAREHVDAPVAPRSAGNIEHLTIFCTCELEDGDKLAVGAHTVGTEKLRVVGVQIDVFTRDRVF